MSISAQLAENLMDWGRRLTEQAAENVYFALRDNAPQVSGELMNAIERPVQIESGPTSTFSITVAASHGQEDFTEYGTEPHPIDPVSAPALRFPGKGGGIVFAAHVDHPGNQPRPWFFPTCEREWPLQLQELSDVVALEL